MSFNYDDYIDLIIAKNDDGFKAVYDASKNIVYAIIRQKIKDPNTIEDLMQETYIKAIKSIKSYQKNGKFIKWLSSIAYNLTMDYYRINAKVSYQSEDSINLRFKTAAVNHEQRALVEALLKALDPIEATIVLYHIIDDYTFKDISKMVDKPLGTVLWMYQNALKKMRTEATK
ncbi:RNA polymerase sigma factor [Paracholeplasma manati]|uniref:RNA polymerase sigma factor n=1 Tax=Paracholeplasma manati TaxID=591373 RepID=A0ABT2Y5T9_9MOLU|nr:RNA polymerase sigma factor [Paracholeplasma manati]MCV2232105.1 RNA polymerase sigma factor [Paracholeplasma manati]MDG0887777.1 RNA polymerase sigma factor [Paracholeplasma manati]